MLVKNEKRTRLRALDASVLTLLHAAAATSGILAHESRDERVRLRRAQFFGRSMRFRSDPFPPIQRATRTFVFVVRIYIYIYTRCVENISERRSQERNGGRRARALSLSLSLSVLISPLCPPLPRSHSFVLAAPCSVSRPPQYAPPGGRQERVDARFRAHTIARRETGLS